MYLHFMSFFHIDMTHEVEIILQVKNLPFYIVNIMGADVLATRSQGISNHDIYYVEPN